VDGLHTVEAAWRQFRAGRPSGEMLRTSLKHRESYIKFIGLTTLPAQVALPMGIPLTLVKDGTFFRPFKSLCRHSRIWACERALVTPPSGRRSPRQRVKNGLGPS
jgi:hypothetical protein